MLPPLDIKWQNLQPVACTKMKVLGGTISYFMLGCKFQWATLHSRISPDKANGNNTIILWPQLNKWHNKLLLPFDLRNKSWDILFCKVALRQSNFDSGKKDQTYYSQGKGFFKRKKKNVLYKRVPKDSLWKLSTLNLTYHITFKCRCNCNKLKWKPCTLKVQTGFLFVLGKYLTNWSPQFTQVLFLFKLNCLDKYNTCPPVSTFPIVFSIHDRTA